VDCDLLVVGGGAAGLAAAIFAGEAARGSGLRIVVLEGARKPGAKILVSGGGRCNVVNERVTPDDYFGGSRTVVRNVLRAFDEHRTIAWMREMGVELKLEPTGKYFPVTNSARTVLDALLRTTERAGATLRSGVRVGAVERDGDAFVVRSSGGDGAWRARRVVLATGGLSLPKSGSDGWGLGAARRLGHSIVPTTPALSPLVLRANATPGGRFADFAGITIDARLALLAPTGKVVHAFEGSTLFTHFGLSGPVPLNLSRHILRARLDEPQTPWRVVFGHPRFATIDEADAWLRDQAVANPRRTLSAALKELFPERLADAFAADAGKFAELSRDARRQVATRIAALELDVAGDRGYSFAETTAGGVDLAEVDARTMESRVVPGLHFCGEMLDIDGRIGGFNFQWAWASGHLAGKGAIRALTEG